MAKLQGWCSAVSNNPEGAEFHGHGGGYHHAHNPSIHE
jgi:hypothetical protein